MPKLTIYINAPNKTKLHLLKGLGVVQSTLLSDAIKQRVESLNTNEIDLAVRGCVPPLLWDEFSHLSYAEMAEQEELEEYADILLEAENLWHQAEGS